MLRLLPLLLLCRVLPILAATPPSASLLAGWVAMDAPTGHEHHATGALAEQLDGWRVDRMGNLLKTVEASPNPGSTDARVVACLLDAPAFTVSEIRDDGYLRLHDIGRPRTHALWAQQHEGQQLRILTASGPVIGVSALANGHFMNLHQTESALTRTDDLWVDVGAESAREVEAMGIGLLDPVLRHLPPWHFGNWIAGPASGARIGCAAVVAAAEAGLAGAGPVHYVLSSQSAFGAVGLSAAVSDLDNVSSVLLLGRGIERGTEAEDPGDLFRRDFAAFDTSTLTVVSPVVDAAGTLMERVHGDEAARLAGAILASLGLAERDLAWTMAPPQANPVNDRAPWLVSTSGLDAFSDRLRQLGELYAVSGYEAPVRLALMESLPGWAQKAVQTDSLGNLWLEAGPADAQATVFMAHMDEVGWIISAIHGDGTVDLERRGGALALAREGQPALLHVSPESGSGAAVCPPMLRGTFLNRAEPDARWPATLQAWFGLDGLGLEAAGVTVGMPVTGYKEAHRVGPHRFTVRGMDDRVGSAALLTAVQRLDPSTLTHRVIFAWTVQEEGGLRGARALAERFGATTRRVYSIDTFVSSDTPLESSHFAYAPLGKGPVLRSMESSGLVTPPELARNRAVAASSGIQVQVGMTQGGTDGTAFTYHGAPNAGLSWPGRYSHGPAELGDLRDMEKLVGLIGAFVHADPTEALSSPVVATPAAKNTVTVGGNGRNCAIDPQCINRLHPAIPMTAEAHPGQTLVMHTRNASDFDLDPDSTYEDPRREGGNTGHALTGPVRILGARAGDTLAVTILDVAPGQWGKTWVGGGGFLADIYPGGYAATWKLGPHYAVSDDIPGVRIPNAGFPGVITTLPDMPLVKAALRREGAVAATGMRAFLPTPVNATPEEICGAEGLFSQDCLRTIPPREHGGNMDIRYMGPGVTLYLPCMIDGCGLAIGDVHYAQGDGEVSGTAIEMDATVTLTTEILAEAPALGVSYSGPASALAIPGDRFFATTGLPLKEAGVTPPDMEYLESAVVAELESLPDDIALAARNALTKMIDYLVRRGYSEEQAYVICSVAVDLRIGQLVDAPNVGATAILPLGIFTETR